MKTGKQVMLWTLPIIAFGVMLMMAADRGYREGIEDRITAAIELFPLGDDPDGVARLDTSTGEIWMLNSTLRNSSVAVSGTTRSRASATKTPEPSVSSGRSAPSSSLM